MDIVPERPPQLTVLIPVYNGRAFLREQLDSILADPLVDRVILCDDASVDDTWSYLETLADDRRIVFFRNPRNLGVIRTVERLLERVDTELFALADQDDVWKPNRIAQCLEALRGSSALLVYSDLTVVGTDLGLIHPSRWHMSNQKPVRGDAVESLIVKSPVNGCTVVASRALLRIALPFPPGIPMHDTWLAAVAAAVGKLEFIDAQTVLYRQHGSNESGGASPYSFKGMRARIRRHAAGSVFRYSHKRLQERLALIDGLLERGLQSETLRLLRSYYSASTAQRIARLPQYLGVLRRRCDSLGLKNMITDIALTLVPDFD